MLTSVQAFDHLRTESLGLLMDESVRLSPQKAAYLRVRATDRHTGYECVIGLAACAAKGTSVYDRLSLLNSTAERISASQLRDQTVYETFKAAFFCDRDIMYQTVDPECCIYVTLNPERIDSLFRTILVE